MWVKEAVGVDKIELVVVAVFFFSSRRRHTRWPRDWSSDVCSSDLKDWIQEAECVPHEEQAFRGAISGMKRIIAGDEIRPDLLSAGQMLLNPKILLQLTLEDDLGRFDATTRQVFALSHNTDADHLIVLRDVPEPPFLRDEGDG